MIDILFVIPIGGIKKALNVTQKTMASEYRKGQLLKFFMSVPCNNQMSKSTNQRNLEKQIVA